MSVASRTHYHRLQECWRAAVVAEDPDGQQLRHLHQTLCAYEMQLFEAMPERCLANLKERLAAGSALGLALPLPLWVALISAAMAEELSA